MVRRWCIWFAVEGDLRFLSHHETMRAIDRIVTRAHVPVRYTRGFNPHPVISLPAPRPAGVASDGDPLVLALADDTEDLQAETLLEQLNAQRPEGMRFLKAEALEPRTSPQPVRITYELPLSRQKAQSVRARLDELTKMRAWDVLRRPAETRQAKPTTPRSIDIKPLIESIELAPAPAALLRWTALCGPGLWARPGEVLRLLGLDERLDLASLRRTKVQCSFTGGDEHGENS